MSKPPIQLELLFSAVEKLFRPKAQTTERRTKTAQQGKLRKLPKQDDQTAEMQRMVREKLTSLGLEQFAAEVTVSWQPRLRSTAGRAYFHQNLVELNPRLTELGEDELERTLWHEVAHLVAHHRNRRRRIAPHGIEWQQACAELGIPGESATHHLPLPSHKIAPKFTYRCPHCLTEIPRVRKMKRYSACYSCCKKHNRGRYDDRFRLQLLKNTSPSANL